MAERYATWTRATAAEARVSRRSRAQSQRLSDAATRRMATRSPSTWRGFVATQRARRSKTDSISWRVSVACRESER
jgi:hypothetical protein